jgi:hypothetical protein
MPGTSCQGRSSSAASIDPPPQHQPLTRPCATLCPCAFCRCPAALHNAVTHPRNLNPTPQTTNLHPPTPDLKIPPGVEPICGRALYHGRSRRVRQLLLCSCRRSAGLFLSHPPILDNPPAPITHFAPCGKRRIGRCLHASVVEHDVCKGEEACKGRAVSNAGNFLDAC